MMNSPLKSLLELLLKLMPREYKAYADVGFRMFERLDTKAERDKAIDYLLESLKSDGYLSVPEWSKFGGMCGILGKPKQKKAKETEATEVIVAPTG